MHINLEKPDHNAIRSYSDSEIKINDSIYQNSLIISRTEIMTGWPIHLITNLDMELLAPLLKLEPEVIIIGHNQLGVFAPVSIMQELSKLRIGIECMSIGAASRTFNVLLSEERSVVAGIIF